MFDIDNSVDVHAGRLVGDANWTRIVGKSIGIPICKDFAFDTVHAIVTNFESEFEKRNAVLESGELCLFRRLSARSSSNSFLLNLAPS